MAETDESINVISRDDLASREQLEPGDVQTKLTPSEQIQRERERIRGWTTKGLVLLLIGTTIAIIIIAYFDTSPNHNLADTITKDVYTPIVAIVGTVLGFYFGGHGDPKP